MNPDTIEQIARHRGRHLRVLGPPGSGKTTALIERFHSLQDDDLRPAVITFSRAARERLVARLMPAHFAHAGRFPVYTYHQLALDILARAAPLARRPLGDVEERVVLSRVLRDPAASLASDYASIADSDAFARTLLAIIHTLEQNGVSADRARATQARSRRARDILDVFDRFETTLEERGLATYYNVSWKAALRLRDGQGPDPLGRCGALLIDDFHDIDAGQFALVEALAPPDGSRAVTVFGDPTGSRFAFRGTTSRFLDEVFPARYTPDERALALHGPVAAALLAETGAERFVADSGPSHAAADLPLFQGSAAGDVSCGPAVSLTVAADEIAEAQHVALAAAELIGNGVVPADVAVIARDRGRYELVLANAFAESGVDLDTGAPQRHELETFTDALLGLLGGRADERLGEVVTASPFYTALRASHHEQLQSPRRRAAKDPDDVRRLAAYLKGACVDKKSQVLRMSRFLDETVRVVARAPGMMVPDAAVAAVARLADEWNSYEEMTRHVGGRPRIGEFRRQRRAREAVALERDPRSVAFYTAREATTRSFRVAFVVGCADGVFPAMDSGESYVPYDEFESLFETVTFHQARGRRERLRDEYGLLLSALTRGSEQVRVSAPLKLAGREVPAPARVLGALSNDGNALDRVDGPRTRAARAVARAGHGFAGADVSVHRIARAWTEAPLERRTFAIDEFAMSPSRLGTYVECPRKLFYGRVLGIEEEKSIYLTVGGLFHKVMEVVGKEFSSRDALVAGLSDERIAEFVDDAISASRDLGPDGSLVESLTRQHLVRMVAQVRAIEKSRPGSYDIETELPGEFERAGRAYTGRLDRVDSVDGRARVVIDYKASSAIHKTGKTIRDCMLNPAAERRYWQVPMYSFGARTGGDYPDLFCYYVVPPGEESFAAGLYVSDDPDRHKREDYFEVPSRKRPFDTVAPDDLDRMMDEVDAIRDEIFAERAEFARTEDRQRCKNCFFNRVCERRDVS